MTGRHNNSPEGTPIAHHYWRLSLFTAAFVAGGVLVPGAAAQAQSTVIVGGSGQSPVVVNLSVLNQLGDGLPMGAPMDPPGTVPRSAFVYQELTPPRPVVAAPVTTPTISTPTVTATTLSTIPEPLPLPLPEPEPLAAATFEPTESLPVPEPLPTVTAEPVMVPEPEPKPEPESVTTLTFEPPPLTEPEPLPEPMAMPDPLPEPETMPEPVPEPETEVAAVSPAETVDPPTSESLRIEFAGDSAELPGGTESNLRVLADRLIADNTLRAQVKAYAGSSTGSASAARRLSLSRALAVRSVLIEQGVRSTRIDVRALGDRNEDGPPERVDVLLVKR